MIEDYSYQNNHNRYHRIKRDYFNKSYTNPYFNNKEKSKKFNTKLYIRIILIIFLIYLIVYSDLFKIKNVEIQGTEMINLQEIQSLVFEQTKGRIWWLLPRNNLLFFNKNNLIKEINNQYLLNKLEIDKKWQKIVIKLEEKNVYLIFNNLKSQYFLDINGAITKEISNDDISKYEQKFPLVYIMQEVKVGDKPVSARFVNFVLELDKALKEAGIKVKNYEGGGVDQVNLVTVDGWKVFFSLNIPISQSIENLNLILSKKLKNKKFEYIDLRNGDKVYYK